MTSLPSGTVTFLFTDMEGSTRAWDAHAAAMSTALGRHNEILRAAIDGHAGYVFKTMGDEFCAAFADAGQAVAAAIEAQIGLAHEPQGDVALRVRMAIHSGHPEERDGDYFGVDLSRVSRLLGIAHGGQVLLSGPSAGLARTRLPAGCGLLDLGQHRLRDLQQPEQVFMLTAPGLESQFPPLRSLSAVPNNLVSQLSSFVNREADVDAIVSAFAAGQRLVTLTGPGGVGKTRLALEAAGRLLGEFGDGVWKVDLAPLNDGRLIPAAVASVLSLREAGPEPVLETLVRQLAGSRVLLILDNCEHLLAACGGFARSLLERTANLAIAITSREALGIAGEMVVQVSPLALPPAGEVLPLQRIEDYPALRLWRERAAMVRPGFAFSESNASQTVELCRRLDGLPLAIELGASRLSSMTAGQILERISGRIPALGKSDPSREARQQTLQALIDWSAQLLTEPQRRLYQRLAIFSGGWDLEAAVAVCSDPGDDAGSVADRLSELVDKSLVVFEDQEGAGRYRYLDTIRSYARERLADSGEEPELAAKHRDWCRSLATEGESNLRGPAQGQWLARLEQEMPNFRAAMAGAGSDGAEAGIALAGTLGRFWMLHGHYTEGREWLDELLAAGAGASADVRALACYSAAILAHAQADFAGASGRFSECKRLYALAGNRLGEADALTGLANTAWRQGQLAEAADLHRQSLAIYREAGDERRIAASLNNLGLVLVDQRENVAARALYEESLGIKQRLGDELGSLSTLHNLALITSQEGDNEQALQIELSIAESGRELGDRRAVASALLEIGRLSLELGQMPDAVTAYGEALKLSEEMSDAVRGAESVDGLAAVATDAREWELAAELHGVAAARKQRHGVPLSSAGTASLDRRWAALARAMGEERLAEVMRRGSRDEKLAERVSRVEAAVTRLAEAGAAKGTRGPASLLTAREAEILALVASGMSNKQVADRLVLSVRTVETHLANVYGKIGASGRAEAAAFAVRNRLPGAAGPGEPAGGAPST